MKKIFSFIFGIILLSYGGYYVLASTYFAFFYTHTTGSVIDTNIASVQVGIPKFFVHPVVKFVTREGATVTFTSQNGRRVSDDANGNHVGDTVAVWYNPNNPSQAVVYSFYLTWLMPMLFTLAGVGALLAGFKKLPRGSIKVVDLALNSFQTRYNLVKLGILKTTDETDPAPLLYTTDGKNFYGSYDEALVNKNKKLADTFSLLRRQNPVNWKTTKFYDKPLIIDIALRLAADQPAKDEDSALTEITGVKEKNLGPVSMSDYFRGAAEYITRANAHKDPNVALDNVFKELKQRLLKVGAKEEIIDNAIANDKVVLESSYRELAARYALAKKLGAR